MAHIFQHKSVIIFATILTVCAILSVLLSRYIPAACFDYVLMPVLVICATTVALVGALIIFRHSEGLQIRKIWGYTLLVWGFVDGVYTYF